MYYALNRGGGSFGPVTTYAQILTNPPPGFGTADVNGDGHQDIVYGYNAYLYVAFGRGDGTFAAPRHVGSEATPPGSTYLAIQDVNGDGRPDIVTSNNGSPFVQLQDATGQFSYSYGAGPAVGDMGFLAPVFADFDGDGVGDVITGATGALVFSKGHADGSFTGARATLANGTVLDLQPVDLNQDGFTDLAVTSGGSSYYGTVATYLGQGTDVFTLQSYAPNPSYTLAGQSSIADFNGDGIPDIFNAGYGLPGDGQGGFLPTIRIATLPQGYIPKGYTVVADFNEDGVPDGVTATDSQNTGPCTLAVGLSAGGSRSWTTQQIVLPYGNGLSSAAMCSGPVVTGDFNGDGHKDLATASNFYILTFLAMATATSPPGR